MVRVKWKIEYKVPLGTNKYFWVVYSPETGEVCFSDLWSACKYVERHD
jgi:hypothetical protein